MGDFEPSGDFVLKVMRKVHAYEASRAGESGIHEALAGSRLFRWAVSFSGMFVGVLYSPAVCI